jgi:hypothetical protein
MYSGQEKSFVCICLRIISFLEVNVWLNYKTSKERRDELCLKTLNKIVILVALFRGIYRELERIDALGCNLF